MSNSSETSQQEQQSQSIWLQTGEAAALIGVSNNTLLKLVKEGHIKAYRIKGVRGLRFKRGDVEALVEEVQPEELNELGDE